MHVRNTTIKVTIPMAPSHPPMSDLGTYGLIASNEIQVDSTHMDTFEGDDEQGHVVVDRSKLCFNNRFSKDKNIVEKRKETWREIWRAAMFGSFRNQLEWKEWINITRPSRNGNYFAKETREK